VAIFVAQTMLFFRE